MKMNFEVWIVSRKLSTMESKSRSDAQRNADIAKMVGWILALNGKTCVFYTDGKSEPVNILHLPKPDSDLVFSPSEWSVVTRSVQAIREHLTTMKTDHSHDAVTVISSKSFIRKYPDDRGAVENHVCVTVILSGQINTSLLTWTEYMKINPKGKENFEACPCSKA